MTEPLDLAKTCRLMQDPDVGGGVVALISAMRANDMSHPSIPPIPVIPIAADLAESPESSVAAMLQLGALLLASLGTGPDVESVLQTWALLQ